MKILKKITINQPAFYKFDDRMWKTSQKEALVSNLCLGNSDAHGKNISFFVNKSGKLQLAPFYDIVNITLHEEFDHDLAMAIGDQFQMMKISAYDLALHCNTVNIKENLLISIFNTVQTKILKHIESGKLHNLASIDASFVDEFSNNVVTRMEYLLGVMSELKQSDFRGYF